jgi:hypothetical protein
LTDSRAVYLGMYLMIGVPLYTVTLGQFAGKSWLREESEP